MNFSQHVPLLIDLTMETASLVGFFFIFRAFIKLKIYGEMRSMMAPHARLNQILLLLFSGAALIYFPGTTREILVDAFFGTPVIKELPYGETQNIHQDIQLAAKQIMRLIGHISLLRGIVQLGSYQEGGRHSLGKSITHVLGGVCAINIQQTLDLLKNLVGVDYL
jgi:hypothetical protein